MYGSRGYNNSSHHAHHHYPNKDHKGGPPPGAILSPESAHASEIFEKFIQATTFKAVLHHYQLMCDVLRLRPTNIRHFYPKLKNKIRSWKAQALWTKYDKRAAHKCYNNGKVCSETKVLIIGAGPCGLRAAIEAQLLGAKVVVVEKRDRFSRNNVLHLWPFVIADLKALGAKKFYGKFCAGAIDHISIRQLQCILLKVALLLGVEIFEGVSFEELLDPPEDQSQRIGFHARFSPIEHPVNQYEFDVLIGADGKRNTLMGFKRKEFRGKLAIAITANFINKHSEQEACVQEISGVAFIFNQKFFKDLYAETRIDLENIVYYKDETHYFVMTAKKHSLIDKGVILRDLPDTQQLLHPNNVDRVALSQYAREAADFSTGYLMPHLDFAVNHYGKPDIAMFDFTSMFAAENACRVIQSRGHKLLKFLVGDSLLEPFWPTGSGCARGFLSSFDACWGIRSWASGKMTPLEVIAERESIYRLLNQTTPENLGKDFSSYTLEPSSRYPTVNLRVLLPFQVRHLFGTDEPEALKNMQVEIIDSATDDMPKKRKRADSLIQPDTLLSWCQKQVAQHSEIKVENFESSFKDGMVLCAIIHRYRPDLIDFDSMKKENVAINNQMALDLLGKDFGISPILISQDLALIGSVSRNTLISYVSQIHDMFRGEIPQFMGSKPNLQEMNGKEKSNLDLGDFPIQNKSDNSSTTSSLTSTTASRISCKVLEEPKKERMNCVEDLQRNKKRRNESESMDINRNSGEGGLQRSATADMHQFNDRVKGLEAKFRNGAPSSTSLQTKPKDLIRAVGKLEKTDWNLSAIERKIDEHPRTTSGRRDREKVPRWGKENYNDKFQNIERRLRENGEDEERIAKYMDIDASLKRLERKLREGSTLETGLRGHNKVSNLASQLSSKLIHKQQEVKPVLNAQKQSRPMVLPSTNSDLCYFCGTRVYLVERLNAEGKFFHRQCFKCCYCGTLLRLGNYIYDRENKYGGKFFCIPHFGLTSRSKSKKPEESLLHKPRRSLSSSTVMGTTDGGIIDAEILKNSPMAKELLLNSLPKTPSAIPQSSPLTAMDDRGTTPERVEFENSVIEESDEDEYLSEDEWTDRNFGASANELDTDSDSDYSDLSDEEIDEDALESSHQLTEAETRRLAESWKRRYSNNELDLDESLSESEQDLSEEHGADGDDSHTATEGEMGENDDDEEEVNEGEKKALELRRQELNINFDAPPAQPSDSGSDTEVASEDESDTQIDTDSEFGEDNESSCPPKEIPTIVIDEVIHSESTEGSKENLNVINPVKIEPKKEHVAQVVDIGAADMETADKSNSLNDLTKNDKPNPFTEQLKRLLQRTESTEAVTAQRTQLKRNYLHGNSNYSPKKSASTADLGDRFKSFMDKISATQKKLNPAPEPSAAMQAFLNSSTKNIYSPSYEKRIETSFPLMSQRSSPSSTNKAIEATDISSPPEESSETSKSEEGKLFSFPAGREQIPSSNEPKSASNDSQNDRTSLDNEYKENIDTQNDNAEINLNSGKENREIEPCIDARNETLIDSFTAKEIIIEDDKNIHLILDNDLHSGINNESVDIDIISNNLKNNSKDCLVLDGSPIHDVDECFDQLAKDAILDLDMLSSKKILVPSAHDQFSYHEDSIKTIESIDNNFNIKSESIEDPNVQKLDESGFKSMEENKITEDTDQKESHSSDEVGSSQTPVVSKGLQEEEDLPSPETAGLTEGDLSDWAEDNGIGITGVDLKDDLLNNVQEEINVLPNSGIVRARMASLESLDDSDPAISISINIKNPPAIESKVEVPSKEIENMEFMDTSGSESSVEDEKTSLLEYNKLQEEYVAPSTLKKKAIVKESSMLVENDKTKKDLVNAIVKRKSFDVEPATAKKDLELRTPAPHCTDDKSITKSSTTKRYEGYIPRFKDRRTPLSLARDSLDVRKSSVSKPLFTPSREDILARQNNEKECSNFSSLDSSGSSINSPSITPTAETKKSFVKPKDGDLVRDMVMSRMTRSSSEKAMRRGSRNALHLSFNSSASSIFGSEQSLPKEGSATPTDVDKSLKDSETSEESRSGTASPLISKVTTPNYRSSPKPPELTSPRTILPATPLTHPEKFIRRDPNKRELFKSTPHLPSASMHPTTAPPLPSRAPYINTEHLNASTQTFITKTGNKPQFRSVQSQSPSLPSRRSVIKQEENKVARDLSSIKKDPEERLRELLAERRRKEAEEQQRGVRLRNKDSCLKECLEEYRQKRNSAPVPQVIVIPVKKEESPLKEDRVDSAINKRSHRRHSRLELEKMQVFSSQNNKLTADANPPIPIPNISKEVPILDRSFSLAPSPISKMSTTSNVVSVPSVLSISPAPVYSSSPLASISPSSLPPPNTKIQSSPNSKEAEDAKRPVKKSKDRERRRSLIQVFAGMFSKTYDKKKADGEEEDLNRSSSSNATLSPPPSSNSFAPPKSPSVKERFSKLRLSRTKRKNPTEEKNRSMSVDNRSENVSDASKFNSFSLPTSPSRTIFSFLSSPSIKTDKRKSASGPTIKNKSGQLYHSSCIKEEAVSEDENPLATGKDTLPSTATPNTRRQKAVMRAAKQAEQKRLRMAQEIQRQLEECDVKTREIEEKGITVEKALIGETSRSSKDETELMKDWFRLVQEKNALVRWQEELNIRAKEVELEDRHVRLENELRQRMAFSEKEKTREDIDREGRILAEIISIIEQKDSLSNLLEEDRKRYKEEDKDLEEVHARKIVEQNPIERETGV